MSKFKNFFAANNNTQEVTRPFKLDVEDADSCRFAATMFAQRVIKPSQTLVEAVDSGEELKLHGLSSVVYPVKTYYIGYTDVGIGYGRQILSLSEFRNVPDDAKSQYCEVVYSAKSEARNEKRTLIQDETTVERFKQALAYLANAKRGKNAFLRGVQVKAVYGEDGPVMGSQTTKTADQSAPAKVTASLGDVFAPLDFADDLNEFLKEAGSLAEMMRQKKRLDKAFRKLQRQKEEFDRAYGEFLPKQQEKLQGEKTSITIVGLTLYMTEERKEDFQAFNAYVATNPNVTADELMKLFGIKKSAVKAFLKKMQKPKKPKSGPKQKSKPESDEPVADDAEPESDEPVADDAEPEPDESDVDEPAPAPKPGPNGPKPQK